MKERPILFNTEMVQAILAGRKTQTRRIFKFHPEDDCFVQNEKGWPYRSEPDGSGLIDMCEIPYVCPFGKAGDRLWVRETFCEHDRKPIVFYKADHPEWTTGEGGDIEKWRPSIHMPRWASRIDLEITNVRVEQVHQISEEDARAEGLETEEFLNFREWAEGCAPKDIPCSIQNLRGVFQNLWNSIYKNWDENPWVWVVEFKRA